MNSVFPYQGRVEPIMPLTADDSEMLPAWMPCVVPSARRRTSPAFLAGTTNSHLTAVLETPGNIWTVDDNRPWFTVDDNRPWFNREAQR